ncbi:hypothetical protein SAMD00019534_067540, partial [Acytostelium subglobosum LB1]|uniref:hypothetical protein n=1 Tax=Acytostelium subglobosum LB1 TaxID=1410327 RepID=UPI0006448C41
NLLINQSTMMIKIIIAITLLVALSNAAGPVVPFAYPLYKQCDPRWGNDIIETTTVCDVGCLMSSISMAIAGHGIEIDGQSSNPGTLNSWLKSNGGYTSGNDLIESVVPGISSDIKWDGPLLNGTALSMDDIKNLLNKKDMIVILNVDNGGHFVLATGYDSGDTKIYVNDPGFSRLYYEYNTVVGYRLFQM